MDRDRELCTKATRARVLESSRFESPTNRTDDALHVFLRELRAQWQAHGLASDASGFGPVFASPAEHLLISGMLGKAQVMHTNADAQLGHGHEEIVAARTGGGRIDQNGEQMVGVAGVRLRRLRQNHRQRRQSFTVTFPDRTTPQPVFLDAPKLVDTDGGLQGPSCCIVDEQEVDRIAPAFRGLVTERAQERSQQHP